MTKVRQTEDSRRLALYFRTALKEAKDEQRLSLREIQKRSGIIFVNVHNILTGKNTNPTMATMVKLADALGYILQIKLVEKE